MVVWIPAPGARHSPLLCSDADDFSGGVPIMPMSTAISTCTTEGDEPLTPTRLRAQPRLTTAPTIKTPEILQTTAHGVSTQL